jgi:hypothetical protein
MPPDDTCEVIEVLNLSGGEFILQPAIQLKSAGTAQGGKYGIEVNERVHWQASPQSTQDTVDFHTTSGTWPQFMISWKEMAFCTAQSHLS